MKVEIIKAIFTNLLFVIGVILLIYGFVQGSLTAVRLLTFDKYPLQSYEESRCDYEYNAIKMPSGVDGEIASPEDATKQRQRCEEQLTYARKVKQTEHIVVSITTFVAGAVLVFSFKRFIFGN